MTLSAAHFFGVPVSGETIVFVLNGTNIRTGVTDGTGVATVTNVSLSGINAGTYPLAVAASFAGDGFYTTTTGTAALTVNPAYAAQIQQPVNADMQPNPRRSRFPTTGSLATSSPGLCRRQFCRQERGTGKPVSVVDLDQRAGAVNYNPLNATANTTALSRCGLTSQPKTSPGPMVPPLRLLAQSLA